MKFTFIKKHFVAAFGLVATLAASATGWSYGPLMTNEAGLPFRYPNLSATTPLVWNADAGAFSTDEPLHPANEIASFCGGGDPIDNNGGGGGCSLGSNIVHAPKPMALIETPEGSLQLIRDAWNVWAQATGPASNVSFQQGASLGVDVNACNYGDFVNSAASPIQDENDSRICGCLNPKPSGCTSSCLNPIIFDANGDITALENGEENRARVLGYATSVGLLDGGRDFVKMYSVINGVCLEPSSSCTITLSENDLKSTLIHELGHALGLAHSRLNLCSEAQGSSTNPCVLPSDNVLKGGEKVEDMPMMFPYSVEGLVPLTLSRDDKIGLAHLYPKAGEPASCKFFGSVFSSGGAGLACREVVLRSNEAGKQTTEAVSFISGAEVANDYSSNPSPAGCKAGSVDCGDFTVELLTPGTTYTIEVNPIVEGLFTGGSSIGGCDVNFIDPNLSGVAINPAKVISCPVGGGNIACNCDGIATCTVDPDLCVTVP